jgi:ATP-binding cassette subfamily B protein
MGLMGVLRFPAFISIFTFSLVQMGIAGARRILDLMKEETELDENRAGHTATLRGDIVFEHVTFRLDNDPDNPPVLRDISFRAAPGETVAIVGQTGSGMTTLTKLVNRTYDVDEGRILIDGVDVREWNLDSLRSQISTIEQDIFLFSRPIDENIAFSLGQQTDPAAIEAAAKAAQAHDFIQSFANGYKTVVGERGVTLSGGQRQRIAIARALLTDPRILILDDSTSVIDSATEDQIQRAIKRVLKGRTTLLITHRLSQIRWADRILVLDRNEILDQGTHEELMQRCELYRRIFARYE